MAYTTVKERRLQERKEFREYIKLSDDKVLDTKKANMDKFLLFLKSIEGKRLYSDDQQFIKEEFETIGLKLRYKGINTFNGALDDNYKDLYKSRFYSTDINDKSYVDKRRVLDNGLPNPNRDKRYWILEDRTDIEKSS